MTKYLTPPPHIHTHTQSEVVVLGFSPTEPVCLLSNLPAAVSCVKVQSSVSCCSPRARVRPRIEVDNEQGDKVELWRSYHPEP